VLLLGPPLVETSAGAMPLFEWLRRENAGDGHSKLQAMVADFHELITADPELLPYFPVDLTNLRRKFVQTLVALTRDGLWQSTAHRLEVAHASVRNYRTDAPITDAIYDRTIGHLVTVLIKHDVPQTDRCMGQITKMVEAARPLVVAPDAPSPETLRSRREVPPPR
jgi:truncated hemoglobin YjbI